MIYGSVCSGIEAATQAWHPLGWTPAFFSEIEKFPAAVLAHHYGSNMPGEPLSSNGVPNLGDMTEFKEWPDYAIDLLVGGTPCQSFSIAGLRKGLADPRGNLMLTYLAMLDRYRPRWCVWENVPGVLSSHKGRDFGTFLGGLGELGYGFACRVLDAQYVRTRGHRGAVPQRRRRVFVVGRLGDWRHAAAVLFDGESMSGNSPPRREAGQNAAPTLSARTKGGGGLGTDFDLGGGLIAADVAPGLTSNPYGDHESREGLLVANSGDVGYCLTASAQQSLDAETETLIAVAHALRGEGFDASKNGTGRGTPIVPVALAFDQAQITSKANRTRAGPELPASTLSSSSDMCVAIQERAVSENPDAGPQGAGFRDDGAAYTLEARHHVQAVATQWAVRRLTPTEAHRLQGFPDNFCNIPWRRKDHAPDGPQYKALGNSMAVNVMEWIGRRLQHVEDMTKGHPND